MDKNLIFFCIADYEETPRIFEQVYNLAFIKIKIFIFFKIFCLFILFLA